MLDPGLKEILLTAIATAGSVIGADRLATLIRGKLNGKTHPFTREEHDDECDRRLSSLYRELSEIKDNQKELARDIKELLKR